MSAERHALVFGASGFIGRWLARELLSQGVRVTIAVRSETSGDQVDVWLREHGHAAGARRVLVDFDADDLGLPSDAPALAGVTEIHNLAGAFRFGMSGAEAYRGNVVTARRIVGLAARLVGGPRLVHVSGYRVGSLGDLPSISGPADAAYDRLGAYEASKIEADRVVQADAAATGVPLTIVNPSTVSGESATGESEQLIGMAANLRDLWRGKLPAIPGSADTFVPVVTVDHLARFMALVPTVPEAAGRSYWVLDDRTPVLSDLITEVGRHYQVAVPRIRVPVGLVRRLPTAVTKADPETLSFLSSERYPVAEAEALAAAHGLRQPDTMPALLRWADHLAAHRFGGVAPGADRRGFTSYDGVRTFTIGDPDADTLVLPGLPVNADTWARTAAGLGEPALVLDLPGLGLSSGDEAGWDDWLVAVAAGRRGLHLVGHSIGAAVAVRFAAAHPEQVARLTLVAPAFLQPAPGPRSRLVPLTAAFLRFASPSRLARMLLDDEALARALASSVEDLRRRGRARRVARLIARGARRTARAALREQLTAYPGEVHLIEGEYDPLDRGLLDGRWAVTTVAGAGHYPQLTHADDLASAISSAAARREQLEPELRLR
ncbi:alpha/beta fold hydrolase [Nocardioides pelophilus]|uniref:alpha/beta fold hydrolase n=1 Tax=Nocardioides pelophilus TaxID=2172019 RepID=UPI0016012647|nr:alpha/beta fold hydrolase [Nocardioides pelophilus]